MNINFKNSTRIESRRALPALCCILIGCALRVLAAEPTPFRVLQREKLNLVSALAFSPDGATLAVGSSAPALVKGSYPLEQPRLPEGTIELWNVAERQLMRSLRMSAWKGNSDTANRVVALVFSPDGRWLLGSDVVGYILWNVDTGEPVRKWHGNLSNYSSSPDWSADGKYLALPWTEISGRRPGVALVDAMTGKEIRFIPVRETGYVCSARVSPSGKLFATAGHDCEVRVFNLSSGEEILNDFTGGIQFAACFSPDGGELIAGSSGGGVLLRYQVAEEGTKVLVSKSGNSAPSAEEIHFVEFTADGKQALSVGYLGIRIWNTSDWQESKVLRDCIGRLSPDGQSIAVVRKAAPNVVELWQLQELPMSPAASLQVPEQPRVTRQPDPSLDCQNNLRQLGLAARFWGMDHGEVAPPDFLSMKELLGAKPSALFCPADTKLQSPASITWETLTTNMISYEFVKPGMDLTASSVATQALIRCTVHGHTCMGDGYVLRSGVTLKPPGE